MKKKRGNINIVNIFDKYLSKDRTKQNQTFYHFHDDLHKVFQL